MKHFIFVLVLLVSLASNAQFGPGQLIYEHPISGGRMIRTADFDQDGDLDAVIAIFDFIAWYPNDGNGNFGEPVVIDENRSATLDLHPVDLDGDDRIDLVVSYFAEDTIEWYRNQGGGVFAAGQEVASSLENARGVVSEDIDQDGDQDLVLGVTNGFGLYWIENLDGLGNFGTEISIDVNLAQARAQAVGDIDGDGDVDVLSNAGSGGDITLVWYENTDGQGDFSNQHIVDTGGLYEVAISLDDLDGDDDLDIISLKTDDVTWRENLDGLGTFGSINIISDKVINGRDIHVADIDNDGDLDVLSTSIGFDMPEDHKVAWYEHLDGNGAFGPQQLIDASLLFPRSVTTADLDDDGDLDVLASADHPDDDRSLWYENETIFGLEDMVVPTVLVSPNPVTDVLQFDVTGGVISEVTGYDVSGRLLLRAAGPISQVDVSGLPNVMLFVHIVTENGSQVVKVVKQ